MKADGPGGPPMMYNYPKQYNMCMSNVELFKDEKCEYPIDVYSMKGLQRDMTFSCEEGPQFYIRDCGE